MKGGDGLFLVLGMFNLQLFALTMCACPGRDNTVLRKDSTKIRRAPAGIVDPMTAHGQNGKTTYTPPWSEVSPSHALLMSGDQGT